MLHGVNSLFVGCGLPNLPSVYTRVSSYVDWIQQTMSNNAGAFFETRITLIFLYSANKVCIDNLANEYFFWYLGVILFYFLRFLTFLRLFIHFGFST